MTAEAILPSSKPSDAAAAFRDDGDNFHAGCDFQSNLAVDDSLDNLGHFSLQYVAGADFHDWAGLFQTGRGIAIKLLHHSETPHPQGHLSGASLDNASRN